MCVMEKFFSSHCMFFFFLGVVKYLKCGCYVYDIGYPYIVF